MKRQSKVALIQEIYREAPGAVERANAEIAKGNGKPVFDVEQTRGRAAAFEARDPPKEAA
ncbi:hypothetical protein [Rhodoplanes roseus]|uniref:hypothetical protein n=1 Tax=Rhodoplanes roseus TaxID=29409 RepID=UPI001AECCA54|nr:hypothetical protein [Rhodoplanes roseus]